MLLQATNRPCGWFADTSKNTCSLVRYLPSTLLISPGPNPVNVLLCLGLEMPAGPTEPWMSTIGADVEGRRWRVGNGFCDAIVAAGELLPFSTSGRKKEEEE